MNILKVEIKQNYGNQLIYPTCAQSKIFCELLNTKTLTQSAINKIKQLGFTFEVQQKSIKI